MQRTASLIQPLLDLFETSLADVRFADLDAKALMRAAGEVESADEEVNAAQAVLDGARAKLLERQEALLQQAHRALAYARVYAEQDEALSAQVGAINLPRPARRARSGTEALVLSPEPAPSSRPARRPRKARPPEPSLEMPGS